MGTGLRVCGSGSGAGLRQHVGQDSFQGHGPCNRCDCACPLHRAHATQIGHFDIKPANALVNREDDELQLYLCDFGGGERACMAWGSCAFGGRDALRGHEQGASPSPWEGVGGGL